MKTLYSTLFLFFICLHSASSQTQLYIDSTRFITGYKQGTIINYAIPTADKGILFVGYDYGNPGGIIPYFPIDTVNNNVLIGKIDSNHQISWLKVYGGSQDDAASTAVQTPDGGYAVLCGTASNDGNVTGYRGGYGDFWLLRLDNTGNLLWEQTYGSTGQDAPMSITNTLDHGFIMSGVTNGNDDQVPFHYGDTWTDDWLVLKTDSMGNLQWSKDIGGTSNEGDNGSILAIDSNYYLISWSNSNDHDCTDTIWHPGVINVNGNYYVLKINDTGKVLWDSSYGGTGGDYANYAMFDTRDSTIVINGATNSGSYMVTGYQGDGDMWVIKINKNGTLIWEKTLGSPNEENGTGICATYNGYMIYGSTFPGPIGGEDCWMFVLNNTGNEITNKIFGGSDVELPNSIVPYLNGYFATGISASTLFTEGTTNGRNCAGEDGYFSYIDTSLPINFVNTLIGANNQTMVSYPNPAQEVVRIITPAYEAGNLSVINSIGNLIYANEIKQQTTYIDINTETWADGLYLIKWQGEDGSVLTTKLIKN